MSVSQVPEVGKQLLDSRRNSSQRQRSQVSTEHSGGLGRAGLPEDGQRVGY